MFRVGLIANEQDDFGCALARSFADEGIGMTRRPREFVKFSVPPDGCSEAWEGTVTYRGLNGTVEVPVRVAITPDGTRPEFIGSFASVVWYAVGMGGFGKRGCFLLSASRVANHVTAGMTSRCLVLRNAWSRGAPAEFRRSMVATRAAKQLAAQITSDNVSRPEVLSFPKKPEGRHFAMASQWVAEERPMAIVSTCCLHAASDRRKIVDSFDPEVVNLLVRTAQAAFAPMPNIRRWTIATFGPKDYGWLTNLNIKKVLLPYMWNAPESVVRQDLERNFLLTAEVVDRLNASLPFPVTLHQLSDGLESIDIQSIVAAADARARVMLPSLLRNPPLIFRQLPTEDDKLARLQQEALLYLIDTMRYGQVEEGREPVVYVGLEVHGGYWQYGNLFVGPNGEFLPLAWFPQSVRQHWGQWTTSNGQLVRERRKLGSMLTQFGF